MISEALLSPCGRYRYTLTRKWDERPSLLYVMFNPSTADGRADDNTIRSCIRIAKHNGFGGLQVVNLFAFRATRPEELFAEPMCNGPDNDQHIEAAVKSAGMVVAAWGSLPLKRPWAKARAARVLAMLAEHADVHALRLSMAGYPWHPLYLPSSTVPVLYRPRSEARTG